MYFDKTNGARVVEVAPGNTTAFIIGSDTKLLLHKVWVDSSVPGYYGSEVYASNGNRLGFASYGSPMELNVPIEIVGLKVVTSSAAAFCIVSGEVTKGTSDPRI